MKRFYKSGFRLLLAACMLLAAVQISIAQEPFQVKWTMDYTQAGASSHPNFTPANAVLAGGANTFTLPTVYSPGGSIVAGYITRPWPTVFSAGRYMEFTFTANSFKYDISSISFRLRRSGDGPSKIQLRTSADAFASDLTSITINNSGVFNTYNVPVDFTEMSDNTFSIRIYAHNASSIYGVLWWDEIMVNGIVQPIILPLELTYFRGEKVENGARLTWETAWEKNTKAFVIERSSNLMHFEEIGSVGAAGENNGRTSYFFEDPAPPAGTTYYRLRLVDRDNSFSFSKTIDLILEQNTAQIHVKPNPASAEKIIVSGNDLDPVKLLLTSEGGRGIPFQASKTDANTVILLPLQPLPPGLYVLKYQKNIGKEHVRILVP